MRKFFLALVILLVCSPWVYSRVFLGWTDISSLKVEQHKYVFLPVFISFETQSARLEIWREIDGKKFYCNVNDKSAWGLVAGELVLVCSWVDVERSLNLNSPPHYGNVLLAWKEEQSLPYKLHVCVNYDDGSDCSSLSIGVIPSNGTSTNSGVSGSYSNETSSVGISGATQGHGSISFLERIKQNAGQSVHNSSPSVWNGYYNTSNSSASTSSNAENSCNSSDLEVYPTSVSVTLTPGEYRDIYVKGMDGCGRSACLDLMSNGTFVNQIQVDQWMWAQKKDCEVKVEIKAPEALGTYSTYLNIRIYTDNASRDVEVPVLLNVVQGEATGKAMFMEPEKFYYVDVPAKSTKHVYFFGCTGPGGYKNEIQFSVEESSYYHQGAIEPIAKFVGSHIPKDDEYPSWKDYKIITDYLYNKPSDDPELWELKPGLNSCPRDYLYSWTTWYGKVNPDYQDFYYCMGFPLTRYLVILTPADERKCGYWAVTLFNNKDEDRSNVRLWVMVAPCKPEYCSLSSQE